MIEVQVMINLLPNKAAHHKQKKRKEQKEKEKKGTKRRRRKTQIEKLCAHIPRLFKRLITEVEFLITRWAVLTTPCNSGRHNRRVAI
jgi:uncharacterized FlaG/YvyC family protein